MRSCFSSFIFCVVTSTKEINILEAIACVVLTTIFLSEHKTLMILLSAPKTTLMDELSEILIYHRFLYLVVFLFFLSLPRALFHCRIWRFLSLISFDFFNDSCRYRSYSSNKNCHWGDIGERSEDSWFEIKNK